MFRVTQALVVTLYAILGSAKTVTYDFDIGWVTVRPSSACNPILLPMLITTTGRSRWLLEAGHRYQWAMAVRMRSFDVLQTLNEKSVFP